MNDATTKTEEAGVRFPFISLEKALGRAEELFKADTNGREMLVTTAFGVWKYSDKSSGGHQTIAALKMYGLIKDEGSNSARKVGLTDTALRYFKDEREDHRLKYKQSFALTPKLISNLWNVWGHEPPTDTVARSYLKIERKFNEQASRSLLGIYKENLNFAELKSDNKIPEVKDETEVEKIQQNQTPIATTDKFPPISPKEISPPIAGTRRAVFALSEGDVVIYFPESLSQESVTDLQGYMDVFMKKAKREAGG